MKTLSPVELYERRLTWEIADNLLGGQLSSSALGDFDLDTYCRDDIATWCLWRNEYLRAKARKLHNESRKAKSTSVT